MLALVILVAIDIVLASEPIGQETLGDLFRELWAEWNELRNLRGGRIYKVL